MKFEEHDEGNETQSEACDKKKKNPCKGKKSPEKNKKERKKDESSDDNEVVLRKSNRPTNAKRPYTK